MKMEENQLEKLVDKAKQGDHAAFEELYSISSRQVYFTCISFLGNEEDAKDVMQDVYITAYEKLSSLNDAEKFVPWVNRIAVNLCKKILMKKSAVFMEIENAADELTEENENFLPEEYITQKEKRKLVLDIMRDTLSDIQYKTVILYYFNGLPLLMRLLTEEANSIDVPDMLHDIMEAVKSHLAAGQIECADAANTSKGGTIKKMLKTPKTIIAATAATVVIIGGIAAAVIATNRENTPSSGSQTRHEGQQAFSDLETDQESHQAFSDVQTDQENQQVFSDAETDQDDQQISSNSDKLVFWLHTVEWGEEKDLTGITLFNGECTTPISLDDFDGDEYLGPYLCNENEVSSYNLTELFDPDQILELRSIDFIPQRSYDEENQTYIYYNEEDECAISAIRLCNYTDPYDGSITYRKAYENNWFYIISLDKFIDEFNIDHKRVFSDQSFDIYDALIDKYGRPSYLIAADPSYFDESNDSFLEMYNKNDGTINYTLVWEKEDFVLVLNLAESIERDKNMHTMDGNTYTSYFFAYVTPEIWPDFIPSAAYWQFYDLDDLR